MNDKNLTEDYVFHTYLLPSHKIYYTVIDLAKIYTDQKQNVSEKKFT